MKTIILLIYFITMSVTVFSQEEEVKNRGQVQYEYSVNSASGTITVISKAFAKKKEESNKEAVGNSLFILLFRGIAGSPYEFPMIPDEQAKKDNPVVKALISGEDMSFIISNSLVREESKKMGGVKGKEATYRITINCESLRRYLVQNGIIRKFGI